MNSKQSIRFRILLFLITAVFISLPAMGQLCTGSLGDAIVKIDFGSGTGRGPALGSSVTAFTYNGTGQLNEGEYTIANSTSGLKGNSWHVTNDHTGNSNGYMMVINSAVIASEGVFYTKSVTGLCPGTTYEFSAWIMNIMIGTDQYHPNITFRVSNSSGTVLGSYNTGDLPITSGPIWKQYGFFFTTGTESTVVITILNSGPSAIPGNDVALDDIAFKPCGPSITASAAGGTSNVSLCLADNTTVLMTAAVSGGYSNPSYQWQFSTDNGSTWTDITGAVTTTYLVTLASAGNYLYRLAVASGSNISSVNCRIVSNNITVAVYENPQPDASTNKPACYGDSLKLYTTATGSNNTFSWSGPNGFTSTEQNPIRYPVSAMENGTYYILVTTGAGCTGRDSVEVLTNGSPVVSAGDDQTICEGSSTTLNGSGSGTSFAWTPAATLSDSTLASPVATPADTTVYILTVSNGQCLSRDTLVINVWGKPKSDAGPDKYMIEGTSVSLSGSASGNNISFYWTPVYNITNDNSLNPSVSPDSDTSYTLNVISNNGCGTTIDTVRVRVYKNITIPNAFSPNNDGINDSWSILQISSYSNAMVTVFNRYGQTVYQNKGYTRDWDGKLNGRDLPVGTYYYIIDLRTEIPLRYSGWVVLLR